MFNTLKPRFILICFSILMLILAGAAYFFTNEIIIMPRIPAPSHHSENSIVKRIALFYPDMRSWHIEEEQLIRSTNRASDVYHLMQRWLNWAQEYVGSKYTQIQMASIAPNGSLLYLSVHQSPFNPQWSCHEKIRYVEGLLKTVRTEFPYITEICFLINHKPWIDADLDFQEPWPTRGFLGDALQ